MNWWRNRVIAAIEPAHNLIAHLSLYITLPFGWMDVAACVRNCSSFRFVAVIGMLQQQHEEDELGEVPLTQTIEEYDISMMMDSDITKVNSILYSNVLCLSKNPAVVDQQFSK